MGSNQGWTPILSGNSKLSYPNHNSTHNPEDQNTFKTCNYVTSSYSSTSENTPSQSLPQNPPSEGAFPPPLRDSTLLTQDSSQGCRRESEIGEHVHQRQEALNDGYLDSNGGDFTNQCPTLLKNATMERGSHFTAVLKWVFAFFCIILRKGAKMFWFELPLKQNKSVKVKVLNSDPL